MTTIKINNVEIDEQAILDAGFVRKEVEPFPKIGDRYWFLIPIGFSDCPFNNYGSDNKILKRQQVFRTKKEAIEANRLSG